MKNYFTLLITFCLVFTLFNCRLSAQHLQTGKNFNGICGMPRFGSYDYKQIEANTKLYNPEIYLNAIKEKSQNKTQTDTVGMVRKFYALNDTSGTNVFYEVNAMLIIKGSLVQIWADTNEIANGHVTTTKANSLLNELENQTPVGSKSQLVVRFESTIFINIRS